MKILFTGASSFTGYWFLKALADAGHEVHATFTAKDISHYEGVRKKRVDLLQVLCHPVFECRFGEGKYIELSNDNWDIMCHHAADVTNYKNPDFDVLRAVKNNTNELTTILNNITSKGCHTVLFTGSVFEQNEGIGSMPLRAFSPYGLSKGLTSDIFKIYCERYGVKLGKFVIPNPFGPFEEPRFTSFLARSWLNGEVPKVNSPLYVRDNIHIRPLAKAYRTFAEALFQENYSYKKLNLSGYVESQGSFTSRFSNEMSNRLNVSCEFGLGNQTEFEEPLMRINNQPIISYLDHWNEKSCWDELAEYYLSNPFNY